MRISMKTSLFRAALAVCLLGSASVLTATMPTIAFAADKPATPPAPVVSKPVGVILDAAHKLILANDFVTAKATVLQAQAVPNRTPMDDYEINNFLGNIYLKLNDHPSAYTAYAAMAESGVIPDSDKSIILGGATLLANEAKHFDKAIQYGNMFLALGGPPDDRVLTSMSVAYYFTNDFANAETFGLKAIAATPAGKIPNQGAYDVVLSCEVKAKKDAEAIKTLEQMVGYYNDPGDWAQLIDSAFGTAGMKPTEALFLYRLRFATKASTSGQDYGLMAGMAITLGYPAEALAALEAGLAAGKLSNSGKTGAQLADARTRTTRDRATVASFDSMATKSPNGELDVKLAETYYGYGRYSDAEAAARRGLGKGGAKMDANEANMVLGQSLAMEGKDADALAAFNNVKGGSAAMLRAAHLWSLYAGRKTTSAAAATH
jgi:tetratricopeptide (TPR) repeat protein